MLRTCQKIKIRPLFDSETAVCLARIIYSLSNQAEIFMKNAAPHQSDSADACFKVLATRTVTSPA